MVDYLADVDFIFNFLRKEYVLYITFLFFSEIFKINQPIDQQIDQISF
jgi:hypothetical protein